MAAFLGPSLCYRFNTVFSRRACRFASFARHRVASECYERTSETADRNQRMHQQPESLSPTLAVSSAASSGPESDPTSASAPDSHAIEPQSHRVPRWLERVELFLRVMLRLYIGLAVCYAPWSHTFWDQNPLFLHFPALADFAAIGAVRGIVSGLGLLNLWLAFHDAMRRRDG